MLRLSIVVTLLMGFGHSASAFERMRGCFTAERACPAPRSIRTRANPGEVRLEGGKTYELLGANKIAATHFQIRIEGAEPRERWVEVGCGAESAECSATPVGPAPLPSPDPGGTRSVDNLLAISWQPAFCETHEAKPECSSQTPERFDAANLTLHGLWPQPRGRQFCDVSDRDRGLDDARRWSALPAIEVDTETAAALASVMPGIQSGLDRHEWIKHGTCYGTDADTYFDHALLLTEQVNASPVRALIAGAVGDRLSIEDVRAAFDEAFGGGAGERVDMDCDDGLITELRLNLVGAIEAESRLGDLLRAARPASESCASGRVDAVGFSPEN